MKSWIKVALHASHGRVCTDELEELVHAVSASASTTSEGSSQTYSLVRSACHASEKLTPLSAMSLSKSARTRPEGRW